MIAGEIKQEFLFRSRLGVIKQSVHDCAVRRHLPLALDDAVFAGTMDEVVGTVAEPVRGL